MYWPFSLMPAWLNFIAVFLGYCFLLSTVYLVLMIYVNWNRKHYIDDEELERVLRIRERLNG